MDGWKEHEANMGEKIKELSSEKEAYKEDSVKLKEVNALSRLDHP